MTDVKLMDSRPDLGALAPDLVFDLDSTRPLIQPETGHLKWWREKRWCYLGVVHPDVIFGAAMAHLGYLTHAFAYCFDRKIGEMVEAAQVFLPLGPVRFDPHPEKGNLAFSAPGARLSLAPSPRGRHLTLAFPKKGLLADIHLNAPDTGFEPRHFYMPTEKTSRGWTTKAAGLGARGSITTPTAVHDLGDQGAGLFDWTHGVYPRQTQWNWVCGAGTTDRGAALGFNFSAGVYEHGELENTVWLNGRPCAVGPIAFDYSPSTPMEPWQIRSKDGKVDLTFTPEGIRGKTENFVLVKSAFIQPCGSFQGRIMDADGTGHTLGETAGVTEEHFALW